MKLCEANTMGYPIVNCHMELPKRRLLSKQTHLFSVNWRTYPWLIRGKICIDILNAVAFNVNFCRKWVLSLDHAYCPQITIQNTSPVYIHSLELLSKIVSRCALQEALQITLVTLGFANSFLFKALQETVLQLQKAPPSEEQPSIDSGGNCSIVTHR